MDDRAGICLSQWVDRARAMHTPTWAVWQGETVQALAAHRAKCAKAASLVQLARFAMLDHDLHTISVILAELERLFCETVLPQ